MAVRVSDARERDFERLYRRYVQDVYRYALAVLRNPADAEDVTQTTFLNAYRAYLRGEEPRKPQHWLITIAHNACRTRAIRASRRPREVPLETAVIDLAVPEQERPNVSAVLGALGRLPFNQRSAIVMRELEGRSYEEIAETLGVSVSAVETLIFRARRSLRVRRDALRGLTSVSVPASLQSFVGGSVAQATGGAALGGLAAKAAAVIVALVAGTAGYEAVEAGVTHASSDPADQRAVTLGTLDLSAGRAFAQAPRATSPARRRAAATGPAPAAQQRVRHDAGGMAASDLKPRHVADVVAFDRSSRPPASDARHADPSPPARTVVPAVGPAPIPVPALPQPELPDTPPLPSAPAVSVPVSPPSLPEAPSVPVSPPSLPEAPSVPELPPPPNVTPPTLP